MIGTVSGTVGSKVSDRCKIAIWLQTSCSSNKENQWILVSGIDQEIKIASKSDDEKVGKLYLEED